MNYEKQTELKFESAINYQPEAKLHKFYKAEDQWMVYCVKTKGRFSTAVWQLDKVNINLCPCCNETVKRQEEKRMSELKIMNASNAELIQWYDMNWISFTELLNELNRRNT